jgi:hypothetical protein
LAWLAGSGISIPIIIKSVMKHVMASPGPTLRMDVAAASGSPQCGQAVALGLIGV